LKHQIQSDVVRLHDREYSFPQIVAWLLREKNLKVSKATARAAFDEARPERLSELMRTGKSSKPAQYSVLGPDVYRRMDELIIAGKLPDEVARLVGCSERTVRLRKKKLSLEN
jgi:hypothetical protein